uniref:esterase/lipase family protein n=1 Tax=Nocardia brasiliensis TaxID=37326 RepID=UPI003D78FFC5
MAARRCRWGVVALAVAVAVLLAAAPAAAETGADWTTPPTGANDWTCVPAAAYPQPVLLVHGTWDNQSAWDTLAPQLKAHGVCVFSLNYGHAPTSMRGAVPGVFGTADIRTSAKEFAAFVARVRAAPGAARGGILGPSQGRAARRRIIGRGPRRRPPAPPP